MSDAVTRYLERFEEDAPALPGHGVAWLDAARREAISTFGRVGFPKPREEDWKYTRVAPIERQAFVAPSSDVAAPDVEALRLAPDTATGSLARELVFVDGRHRSDLDRGAPLPTGVELLSLDRALTDGVEALRPYLAPDEAPAHGFLALNAAFAGDGVLLRIAEGVSLDEPLHLLFVASGAGDHVAHPRVVLDCAPGSTATVVEHYAAAGDSTYFNNVVTQATLGEGASLTHYKLQRESSRAFHVSTLAVHQGAGSRFTSHSRHQRGARRTAGPLQPRRSLHGPRAPARGLPHARGPCEA
jgi:Fe-S cluster assembly protein SufD